MAFKDEAVARLLPPEGTGIKVGANKVCLSAATLERWHAGALLPGRRRGGSAAAARLDAVLTTVRMRGERQNARCTHGVNSISLKSASALPMLQRRGLTPSHSSLRVSQGNDNDEAEQATSRGICTVCATTDLTRGQRS